MLLQKATNKMAFAKIGIFGFAGAGKTYTAVQIANGLAGRSGGKPIAFFDTEGGSDFMIQKVEASGVELLTVRSRSFQDLCQVITEAESQCCVLIIDSISHVWKELTDSYAARMNRQFLQFQDWGQIKKQWGEYTTLFLNSKIHIIVCGRAGWDYEQVENADTGKADLVRKGTKMRVESEFGFEPNLVVEMERITQQESDLEATKGMQNVHQRKKARQAIDPKSSGWIHRATVLKDRSDTINGQSFDYPTYESFASHFAMLNIGGEHQGFDASRNSEGLFEKPDSNGHTVKYKREAAKENILNSIASVWPGQTANEKKYKNDMFHLITGDRSTGIFFKLHIDTLEAMKDNALKWADEMNGTDRSWEAACESWGRIVMHRDSSAIDGMGEMPEGI